MSLITDVTPVTESLQRIQISGDNNAPSDSGASVYSFTSIPISNSFHTNNTITPLLHQWNLDKYSYTRRFRYDAYVDVNSQPQLQAFLKDFFKNEVVRSSCRVMGKKDWTSLGNDIQQVKYENVPSTLTNVSLFDKAEEQELVSSSGHLRACLDEPLDNIIIQDELRRAVLISDSEKYDTWNEKERQQLLFRVWKHLLVGGPLHQPSETLDPYITATRALYRELCSARLHPQQQKAEVVTSCFEIKEVGYGKDSSSPPLFPSRSPYHICWLTIDPTRHYVTLYYSAFVRYW